MSTKHHDPWTLKYVFLRRIRISWKFFPELNGENALVLRQLRVGPLSNLFLVCRGATLSDDQS
jgi:hypothetical protein